MKSYTIPKPEHFDLDQIFSSGQAFRFEKIDENTYEGVAFSKIIQITDMGESLRFDNCSEQEYYEIWQGYFDLAADYQQIIDSLCLDPILELATSFGSGIRILRQPFFETLITFIISQQNNIPRIKKIVSALCENFGRKLIFNEKTYYAFPSAATLSSLSEEELSVVKCGFRSKYILDAARKIANGQICEMDLRKMDMPEARQELLKISGVGDKVADCVLLFSLGKLDAFPIDVWMKRVISLYYDKDAFSSDVFGEYAGIAQQYLFFYARENKIKELKIPG